VTALQSLRRAVGTLAGSPVLFVGGVATAAVVAPQTLLSFVGNLGGEPLNGLAGVVASALSALTFFVTPLIVAGTLGMAREALDEGRTSLATFTGVARDRYVSLLLAFLLQVGLSIVLGIVAAILLFVGVVVLIFVVGLGAAAGTGAGAGPGALLDAVGPGALVVGALVLLVAALVFYVPLFFVQFFHVSVVTERAGAVEGYKRSFRAVRRNLLSSLGFTVLQFLAGVLPTVPLFGVAALRLWQRLQSSGFSPTGDFTLLSTTEVVALTGVVLVAQVVVVPLQYTYATAFYGSVSEAPPDDGDDDPTTDPGTAGASSSAAFETDAGVGSDADDRGDAAADPSGDADADDSAWAPDGAAGSRDDSHTEDR
jgi:hypothetical protein